MEGGERAWRGGEEEEEREEEAGERGLNPPGRSVVLR